MFYYINGSLTHLESNLAVLDVGGVGYKLTISGTTYDAMPPRSQSNPPTVKLFTYLAVREDDMELFGFFDQAELDTFRLLITVSGVGPKAAMAILSCFSPEQFSLAVCTEDKKAIAKANGIGPKTAARIILELRDKMMGSGVFTAGANEPTLSPALSGATPNGKLNEAQEALTVLGYTKSEVLGALHSIDTSGLEVEDIIRAALKKLTQTPAG